jgi:hypothetical protein
MTLASTDRGGVGPEREVHLAELVDLLDDIEAGGDSRLSHSPTRQARSRAGGDDGAPRSSCWSRDDQVPDRAILRALGRIGRILRDATTSERAAVYQSLRMQMVSDDRSNQVLVTEGLAVSPGVSEGGVRVASWRGETCDVTR